MKRYKIVEKDNTFTLYERNDYFILGLKLLPLMIVFGTTFSLLYDDILSMLFLFLFILTMAFSISGLVTMPYSRKEMFLDEEKMHQYIAEQKLLDNKPTIYYLD